MRHHTSSLTTDQLFDLAKQVLNNQDQRHVAHLMKSPEYFRQDIIDFISSRHGGTSPDDIVSNMQQAAARKREAAQKQSQDNGGVAVRIIDLSEASKPAPANPRAAVFVDCAICRKEIAVPESKSHEPAFCSTACFQKAQAKQTDAVGELEKFMAFVGNSYYDCEPNTEAMTQYLRNHSKPITSDNLLDAYLALRNSGQLLMPLSVEEMDALTSAQFAAREKIDPEMGGAIAAMNAATKTPETQHWSSNKQSFGQSFERTGVSSRVGR